MSMQLIFAKWVVCVEPDHAVHQNYCVVLKGDEIVDVLPSAEARTKYSSVADRFEGGESHVVLPGFVNCHTHSAMTLLRGIADDLPLMPWLTVRAPTARVDPLQDPS
jgi:5-methylthioadenosine/S-adenosylhomocysteine deaminase